MSGDDIFRAMVKSGIDELSKSWTAGDTGRTALAIATKNYRLLPRALRLKLEATAKALDPWLRDGESIQGS